jgi:hypothetical protein
MREVGPHIACADYWPHGIPEDRLAAYKAMLAANQITRPRVTVSASAGSVLVEYMSAVPHEWIRQEMRRMVEEGA